MIQGVPDDMKDIDQFISGFKDFQAIYFCSENKYFSGLEKGQNPRSMVIACSDSRVDPAILMGCEPGDIFVVRNVANLVPPYESAGGHHGVSAALEYAVKILAVENIIVLGHSSCGGISALMAPNRQGLGEFIGPWVNIAEHALRDIEERLAKKSLDVRRRACELAAVLVSIDNLLSFPWIRERVDGQTLAIHGWYFDMECGELLRYSARRKTFETMVSRCGG